MRYIDSGSRDPREAVGSWLNDILSGRNIKALRIQVGYVGPQPFGLFEDTLADLAKKDGRTSILMGSNGGETDRKTVDDLLKVTGPSRPNLNIGVVSFADGLFHPKVYQVVRNDGSMAAYVGSANLTYSGISGKNIEAGIALDTRDGDSHKTLNDIADSIDNWFSLSRTGIYLVSQSSDLPKLVADGVLRASRPIPKSNNSANATTTQSALASLTGLIRLPAISKPLTPPQPALPAPLPSSGTATPPFVEWWSKTIRSSDAQRKRVGNQSGAIVLTQAARRGQIDHTTFFRDTLFGDQVWQQAPTRTGHMKDTAQVPMHTSVLGQNMGVLVFEITHDHGRESKQRNYTATLSISPIRSHFDRFDMRQKTVEIGRDATGGFWLDIN